MIQNADNPTMIRVIHKYVLERNAHLPEHKRIKLDNKYQVAFYKADSHGKKEEKKRVKKWKRQKIIKIQPCPGFRW